jgi:exodeoxyribonuclease-3
VPAGGDIPDPDENDKFAHKLDFLKEMTDWFKKRKGKKKNKYVLLGDLNIAPLEHDVWSHKQLLKVVSHTPVEVEHLAEVQKSHSWIDVAREEFPEPEKIFTWWSYRSPDWTKNDRGRRLDHIWVTPALEGRARDIDIVRKARSWKRPSDHVPVLMTLDV